MLIVHSCGSGTSLQDAGRFGFQRFGIGVSGALNKDQICAANSLVGNELETACVEFLLMGGTFSLQGASRLVALAGLASLKVNDVIVAPLTSVLLHDGDKIEVGTIVEGVTAYLSVEGGFDMKPSLGSLSYHRRGLLGYVLHAGKSLPLGAVRGAVAQFLPPFMENNGDIRVVLGPQDDYFTETGIETFLASEYILSPQADRMGYRLTGAKIEHALGFNIVSDGIATGSIQVPGGGEPIVMMNDRQTTGGYPKIATVISSDLPRFSQLRVGQGVRFKAVSQVEAIAIARKKHADLTAWLGRKQEVRRELTSEYLLGLNLVDGFI